jgi:hypothetical protein
MSHTRTDQVSAIGMKKLVRICAIALGAGLLLGFIGPFGTYESMSTPIRFGFWIGGIFIGMIIHVPLFHGAALVGSQYRIPSWIWVSISAVIAALPMTFVINGIFATVLNVTVLDSLFQLYPFVLAISLPMQWLSYVTADRALAEPIEIASHSVPNTSAQINPPVGAEATLDVAKAKSPRLLARLPARLGREIICLEMEDHYLRVFTQIGDTMVHLRMADAAQEMDGVEGMLVHRSYWVTRSAITGWARDGKNVTLHLANGKSVPVARDRQPLVRAAGWLE